MSKITAAKLTSNANNDPSISVDITGDNGEIALMSFSRYDKAMLGITYHPEYKAMLDFNERLENRIQEKMKEINKNNPPADENSEPLLKVLFESSP